MQNRTHIAVGLFFMLFFISKVVHIWEYILIFTVATLLPNVDRLISFRRFKIFNRKGNHPRKRSFFHSFTFCLTVSGLLAWFFPNMAFPFFLAYGTHLIVDSWTVEGIKPFWPLRYTVSGKVKPGGRVEYMIFYGFIVADAIIAWFVFL
jgi:membrane-bound metal-dependent hydrolase YbcI (DUF457 family)